MDNEKESGGWSMYKLDDLFDFDGDLYGENIDVELWKFKRPEMKFDSVEHLKNQMQADIAFGKEYFFEK